MSPEDLRITILASDVPALRAYLNAGGYPSEFVYDHGWGRSIPLLLFAVCAETDNLEMAEMLLRAGADVYTLNLSTSGNRNGTIVHYCRDNGKSELADLIENLAPQLGPRWHREAIDRRIRLLRYYYDKANGFQINPNDWHRPILYGGDYDGAWPLSASIALSEMDRYPLNGSLQVLFDQIRPVIARMALDQDFPVGELMKFARGSVEYW